MLDKVIFFLYVVRTGSFHKAAKQYGISPSAGSRWIMELEDSIGVLLLNRTTRYVFPTEAGKLLFERFDRVHVEINDIFTDVQNLANEDRGIIRIESTPLFARHYLSTIVGEYLTIKPHVTFRITETAFDTKHITGADFAIRANALYPGYKEKDCALVKRPLSQFPLKLCCSPSYINNNSLPEHPSELKLHNCLYASTLVGGNKWVIKENGKYDVIEIAQTIEVENSEIIKLAALAGGGIAFLPSCLIENELKDGRLVLILDEYIDSEFQFNLYYPPIKNLNSRCLNFKNYLIKRAIEMSSSPYCSI